MIQVRVSLSIHFAYLWIKHSVGIGSGRCGFVQSVVATPEWMYVQVGRRFVEHQYTQGEPCYPSHAESKIYTIQLDNVLSHIPKSYSPLLGFFSIVSNIPYQNEIHFSTIFLPFIFWPFFSITWIYTRNAVQSQ